MQIEIQKEIALKTMENQLAMARMFAEVMRDSGSGGGGGNGQRNLFLRNCIEGSERKFDGGAKKVGRLCVHVRILSAYLPFCQRISRSRQVEARVFIIMCPDSRERGRVARCHSQLPHKSWPVHVSSIGFPGVAAA